jgi:hypothetical protein
MSTKTLLAAAALALGLIASPALADTCAVDLTAISGQITDQALNAALTAPIDDVIEAAGSLANAIAQTENSLAELQAFRAKLDENDVSPKAYADQAITILNAELTALHCREG